jgi:peptidoglycan/xylan/chitin deacetylase (PgdA/CDA1 family)
MLLWRQCQPSPTLLHRQSRDNVTQIHGSQDTRDVAINKYVQHAYRMRSRGLTLLQRRRTPRGLILLYHSIAFTRTDPWSLSVTPAHFAEHLQVLQSFGHLVSLPELLEGLENQTCPERMIAVTFDDGYANNLYVAKPLLERFAVPATVFMTVGALENPGEFWSDELEGLLLHPGTLPDTLQVQVNGRRLVWQLGNAAHYTEALFARLSSWRAWKNPPGARQALYRSLWQLLRTLSVSERERVLDELRAWAGTEKICRPTHRCVSRAEALALADGPWIALGAHTMSHPSLATLTIEAQRNEIEQSRSRLMDLLGHSVSTFAYPFGQRSDYSSDTISIVREAGFASACSAFSGTVQPSTDRFQLPRMHVEDWDGNTFSRRLKARLMA